MTVSEYVDVVMDVLPEGTKVNFDIAVRVGKQKGSNIVEAITGGYGSDKIKFSVVKPKKETK